MHNRVVVIGRAVVVENARRHFVEFVRKLWVNILLHNLDVIIAIGSIVHVNKAQSVKQFVHYVSLAETSRRVE